MKVEDLIKGKDYEWTVHKGRVQVLTFDKLVDNAFFGVAQFTNGVILTERVVNLEVSRVAWPPVPHIHAKEMIAFANGYEIECYNDYDSEWCTVTNPIWHVKNKYRVKKDNSAEIAEIKSYVLSLNKQIENLTAMKDKELANLQELQS